MRRGEKRKELTHEERVKERKKLSTGHDIANCFPHTDERIPRLRTVDLDLYKRDKYVCS
jgi:hypothetical protein